MASNPLADDASVEVSAGADITALKLSQDEGFLLSRIMGRRSNVGEIVLLSGMPAEQAKATLTQLVIKGALSVVDFGSSLLDGAPVDDEPSENADPFEGMVFSPRDLNEPTDLSTQQKKRILFIESKLGSWSHYSLLNLKRTASHGDIKKAYFKASKEFHPDAYFRKELGTYKRRVDTIFRAMKKAYDVLNDAGAREEYDATLPADFSPVEQEELRKLAEAHRQKQVDDKRDARLKARMKERRLKRNPMKERLLKARKLIKMAQTARDEGKLADAARHAKMALEYAPQDREIASVGRRIAEAANAERAKVLVKRAAGIMAGMDKDEMCEAAEQLAELAPKDAKVMATAAELLLEGGRPQRGLKFAQTATAADKDEVKAWEVLFRLAAKTNSWATGFRAAENLLRLEPKNSQYKDWMKTAKRNR
jgi:curved DNA-binding protein CbpA